jgi:hypothetical protein
MNYKLTLLGKLTLVGLVAILGYLAATSATAPKLGGSEPIFLSGSATHSAVAASSSAVLVLSANPARQYAAIVNDGANPVYLWLNATSSGVAAGKGIRLSASGGSFEITQEALWVGNIWAITSSGTSTLAVTEK